MGPFAAAEPNALIAVSDGALRGEYRDYFIHEGFAVTTASDALDCLDQLRHHVPDVLILDDELLWGGAAGILALMEEADAPAAPVVLLYHGEPLPAAAHCAVVQACLAMPTSPPELAWAVQGQVIGCHFHHERAWP